MLSENAILNELSFISRKNSDITCFLGDANTFLNSDVISESNYNKTTEHLRLEILDIEKFVKVNDCKQVSNPRAFIRDGIPSDDGLLSNKIFGYTKEERSGIYGYIDLHGTFIDPSCYKTLVSIDKRIRNIVHGTAKYSINSKGELVEDENGKTGLDFLKKNIKDIKFKSSGAVRRDIKLQYIEKNKNIMFITKYLVIPPFYRDMNTGIDKSVGLGGVNKLYNNLIITTNALTATQDYMFDATDSMKGRVQEILVQLYDWFCGNNNKQINTEIGAGISGKLGILRRANLSKTSDYSSRLVITACDTKVESPNDMMVDLDYSGIPLASIIVEFKDFLIFNIKRFFENEFMGHESYPVLVPGTNELTYIDIEDPEIAFSNERIENEMERYVHGYIDRFRPIEIPTKDKKNIYYMMFKGRSSESMDDVKGNPESIYKRPLTWCDIFYMAAVESTKDKHVLITRFPMDKYTNQITTKIIVLSVVETEPLYVEGRFYKYYPKIRKEDIGTDTSNRFRDTLLMSNLFLKEMGGDFDGDQITCKGVYTREANDEIEEFMNSTDNYVNFGCKPSKVVGSDTIQSLYDLTRVLNDTKITDTNNITYA